MFSWLFQNDCTNISKYRAERNRRWRARRDAEEAGKKDGNGDDDDDDGDEDDEKKKRKRKNKEWRERRSASNSQVNPQNVVVASGKFPNSWTLF